MGGMNAVYETDESRSTWVRFGVSLALGVAIAVALVGSVLLVTAAKGWGGLGLAVVRWLGAILLIGLAVGVLVRYAPAESRAKRWDSFGTSLVVAAWIVASVIFKLFVQHVANFRSALGILAAFLVLTTYVYVSSIVFLVGVQVDELLRTDRGLVSLIFRR
jgi:membrane protein